MNLKQAYEQLENEVNAVINSADFTIAEGFHFSEAFETGEVLGQLNGADYKVPFKVVIRELNSFGLRYVARIHGGLQEYKVAQGGTLDHSYTYRLNVGDVFKKGESMGLCHEGYRAHSVIAPCDLIVVGTTSGAPKYPGTVSYLPFPTLNIETS